MKKNILIGIVSCVIMSSCTNESEKKSDASLVKVESVDDNCSKVEVALVKGGTVTFSSSSTIGNMKGNKLFDQVTVYRVIGYSDLWKVDTEFPERNVDTTIILFYDGKLRKIQYRQGFISAVYK